MKIELIENLDWHTGTIPAGAVGEALSFFEAKDLRYTYTMFRAIFFGYPGIVEVGLNDIRSLL